MNDESTRKYTQVWKDVYFMNKDQFMEELMKYSRDDIRKFLENKGKPPKLIPLMIRIKK